MGLKPEVVLSYWIIERILRYMYMIIDFMLDIVIKITNILSSFKYNIYVRNFNISIYILYYLIIIYNIRIYIFLLSKIPCGYRYLNLYPAGDYIRYYSLVLKRCV